MAQYSENGRTMEVIQVETLTKAEVRLFFYFLISDDKMPVRMKKAAEFEELLKSGNLPEEMGYIAKRSGEGFCIRETHPGYYVFYVSVKEEYGVSKKMRKIVKRVKA